MATFDEFMDARAGTITDAKVFEKSRRSAYQIVSM